LGSPKGESKGKEFIQYENTELDRTLLERDIRNGDCSIKEIAPVPYNKGHVHRGSKQIGKSLRNKRLKPMVSTFQRILKNYVWEKKSISWT